MHGFQALCVNMAALTAAVMCSMKLNANGVICARSINLPGIHNS